MTSKPKTPRKSAQSTRKRPAGESAENTSAEDASSPGKSGVAAEPTKKARTKPDQGDGYMRGRRVWPD